MPLSQLLCCLIWGKKPFVSSHTGLVISKHEFSNTTINIYQCQSINSTGHILNYIYELSIYSFFLKKMNSNNFLRNTFFKFTYQKIMNQTFAYEAKSANYGLQIPLSERSLGTRCCPRNFYWFWSRQSFSETNGDSIWPIPLLVFATERMTEEINV